jgi:hypothetical protein
LIGNAWGAAYSPESALKTSPFPLLWRGQGEAKQKTTFLQMPLTLPYFTYLIWKNFLFALLPIAFLVLKKFKYVWET